MLKAITGKTIAQLDTDFRKYLDIRLAAYEGTFKLPTRGFDDVTKLEIAADAAPQAMRARRRTSRSATTTAATPTRPAAAAQAALALDPKQPIARYILAEIAVHDERRARRRRQLYAGLIADGHDSYDLRARLAQIAQEDERHRRGREAAVRGQEARSRAQLPVPGAVAALQEAGQDAAGARRARALRVHRADGARAAQGARRPSTRKSATGPKVRTYGEMATYINPQDPDILTALGARVPRARRRPTRRSTRTTRCSSRTRRRAVPRSSTSAARRALRRDGQEGRREGRARAGDEDRARERRGARAQGELK